ncbi:MAG: MarR family transcriptional regulator [Bacilli bacterium]
MPQNTEHSPEKVEHIEKLLRRVSSVVKRKGREILANFPITPPQFIALLWLNEDGDMTIGELSGKMYLAFSTSTDLIDRMEKSGLVERVRDTNDRRVVRIHMLPFGKEVIQGVLKARREYLAGVMTSFSHEQAEDIGRALELLYSEINNSG